MENRHSPTRGAIETKRAPLVAGSIIAGKKNERIFELSIRLEVRYDFSYPKIDMLYARGEDRHSPSEVFATVLGQATPGWIGPNPFGGVLSFRTNEPIPV